MLVQRTTEKIGLRSYLHRIGRADSIYCDAGALRTCIVCYCSVLTEIDLKKEVYGKWFVSDLAKLLGDSTLARMPTTFLSKVEQNW